jgi:hypothetical protein
VPHVRRLKVGDRVIWKPDEKTSHRAVVIEVLSDDRYLVQNEWPRPINPERVEAGFRPYTGEPYVALLYHLIPLPDT